MRVAIVIVNYRTADLIRATLESVLSGYGQSSEICAVVVDGFSDDGSLPKLESLLEEQRFRRWTELLPLQINGGFGWANNQAVFRLLQRADPPEAIHFLNPDAELQPGAGTALVERLQSDGKIGAVGSQLFGGDGLPIQSSFRFPTAVSEFTRGAATGVIDAVLGQRDRGCEQSVAQRVDWVTGASVLFRTAALDDAGLFDDSFFLYHEEVELMWRLRLSGWSVWHEPRSRVLHDGGAATGILHISPTSSFPPRPTYWYDSRRLMFRRIYGAHGALVALLAWIAGHCIWLLRKLLGLSGGHVPVERELADTVRSLLRLRGDPSRSKSRLQPGDLPRWLGRPA